METLKLAFAASLLFAVPAAAQELSFAGPRTSPNMCYPVRGQVNVCMPVPGRDQDLAEARAICLAHPAGLLVGTVTGEGGTQVVGTGNHEFAEPCAKIEAEWQSSGASARAATLQQEATKRELDALQGVVK